MGMRKPYGRLVVAAHERPQRRRPAPYRISDLLEEVSKHEVSKGGGTLYERAVEGVVHGNQAYVDAVVGDRRIVIVGQERDVGVCRDGHYLARCGLLRCTYSHRDRLTPPQHPEDLVGVSVVLGATTTGEPFQREERDRIHGSQPRLYRDARHGAALTGRMLFAVADPLRQVARKPQRCSR